MIKKFKDKLRLQQIYEMTMFIGDLCNSELDELTKARMEAEYKNITMFLLLLSGTGSATLTESLNERTTLGDDTEILNDTKVLLNDIYKWTLFTIRLPKLNSALKTEKGIKMSILEKKKNRQKLGEEDTDKEKIENELIKYRKQKEKLQGKYDKKSTEKRQTLQDTIDNLESELESGITTDSYKDSKIQDLQSKIDLEIEVLEEKLSEQKEKTDELAVLPGGKMKFFKKAKESNLIKAWISHNRDIYELEYQKANTKLESGKKLKDLNKSIKNLEDKINKNSKKVKDLIQSAKEQFSEEDIKKAEKELGNVTDNKDSGAQRKKIKKKSDTKSNDKKTSSDSDLGSKLNKVVTPGQDNEEGKDPDKVKIEKEIEDVKKNIKKLKDDIKTLDNYKNPNAEKWKDLLTNNIKSEQEKIQKQKAKLK